MVKRWHLVAMAAAILALPGSAAAQQGTAPGATAPDETRATNLRAYVELLRSDVRGQKIAILTEVMQFTDAEDTVFWPIYREYDAELTRLNDERVTLIKRYADSYERVSDAIADELIQKALDLEARRHALKAKVYERVKSALSARTAARFIQVEHQLLAIVDLQIASSLPVVK